MHILAQLSRTITLAGWVKELKRVSTGWIKEQNKNLPDFAWQKGYAVFSVSKSNLEKTVQYISNQETHHKAMNFEDELITLLKKHNLRWNEKYIWD